MFGADITNQVQESTVQRTLLTWLRRQKALGLPSYTHAEVREYRALLECIPVLREQLRAVGLELRDIAARLDAPEDDTGST